jgi:2',3'-cyclic-nucleotide 2'-phosphodiesterase (5'-nucleotidase family)
MKRLFVLGFLLFFVACGDDAVGPVEGESGIISLSQGGQDDHVDFWLTVLHNNDAESQLVDRGIADFGGIARFATLVDDLKDEAKRLPRAGNNGRQVRGSLVGASATGDPPRNNDNPGAAAILLSSGDNFLAGPEFNFSLQTGVPFFDAIGLDLIGYDAFDIGNHEFDFGPDVLADFIESFSWTEPPFLSANLDVSGEPRLAGLEAAGKIAKSTIVRKRGEDIGVVGLTTPNLPFISSPRNVIVNPDVAGAVQSEVDMMSAMGIDKIILISHLQDIDGDIALLAQLDDVDIVIAGGGDELLANPGDLLIPGDGPAFGPYPILGTDMDGTEVPVVTTSGEYGYVGRLIVGFNKHGDLIAIDDRSGPVRVAGGANPDAVDPDPLVQSQVVDPIVAALQALASNVIGVSEVALNGLRSAVRSVETNEGNLIADALLWQADQLAGSFGVASPDVALQNGGGIRNDSVVPVGDITELETFDMVPFANFVTVLENIPRSQFKEILENAVSRVVAGDPPGGTGRFAQIGGFEFVYSASGTGQQLDGDGNVLVPGTRVQTVTLDDGTPIVAGGAVVPGPGVTIATIDFLARGGDQYPYRGAPFTALGVTYQQALANYIQNGLGGLISAADYPEGGEGRIIQVP